MHTGEKENHKLNYQAAPDPDLMEHISKIKYHILSR
jgi:hypothetical protein